MVGKKKKKGGEAIHGIVDVTGTSININGEGNQTIVAMRKNVRESNKCQRDISTSANARFRYLYQSKRDQMMMNKYGICANVKTSTRNGWVGTRIKSGPARAISYLNHFPSHLVPWLQINVPAEVGWTSCVPISPCWEH